MGDMVLIALALYIAPLLGDYLFGQQMHAIFLSNIVVFVIAMLVFYIFSFYDVNDGLYTFGFLARYVVAIIVISVINASLFYLFHLRPYGSWILFISSFMILIFTLGWRFVFFSLTNNRYPLRVLILGAGQTGKTMYSAIKYRKEFKVIGFIDDDAQKRDKWIDGQPVLGTSNQLRELIKQYKIQKVIVSIGDEIKPEVFKELVEAKFDGLAVYEMPTFYEKVTGKIPILHTSNVWLGYSDIEGVKKNLYNTKLNNILNRTCACICLIVLMPIMLLAAGLIKLDSKGPVFYIQRRVGWKGQHFDLIKFRSMKAGQEKNREYAGYGNDPRITRVGKILLLIKN